jgi:hypothetical protein
MFPSIFSFFVAFVCPHTQIFVIHTLPMVPSKHYYKAASMPITATPRPTTGPAVWKAAAPVAAVAAALPDAEVPEAVAERLADALLVPEIAVTEAELEAEPDAAAEADEEAEALEFAAPQSGLVFRVTPAPLQRVSAKEMVADSCISPLKQSMSR